MAAADALDFEGYEVLTATNGAEALEQVRKAQPDRVGLDLMPARSGWEFMEAWRREELCRGTPVLVMWAYRLLRETAPTLGANARQGVRSSGQHAGRDPPCQTGQR